MRSQVTKMTGREHMGEVRSTSVAYNSYAEIVDGLSGIRLEEAFTKIGTGIVFEAPMFLQTNVTHRPPIWDITDERLTKAVRRIQTMISDSAEELEPKAETVLYENLDALYLR